MIARKHSTKKSFVFGLLILFGSMADTRAQVFNGIVSPRATFLRTNQDTPANPLIVSLGAAGFSPGQTLMIEALGDYSGGPTPDDRYTLLGVFSASATLLATDQLQRVPDAIDAGLDANTGNTHFGALPTNIAEDFLISVTGSFRFTVIMVPDGATHLFVGVSDSFFGDNVDPDGDLRVRLTIADTDADGVIDDQDNCPTAANANQIDGDVDGHGDACDLCPGLDDGGTPPPSGIVALWPAEGNAADVIELNSGSLVNNVTFAPGKVGQAFSVSPPDNVVEIPDRLRLVRGPQGLTVAAWVRPTAHGVIFTDQLGCGNWESVQLSTSAFTVNSSNAAFTRRTASFPPLDLNRWNHVAGVWDGAFARAYVNGKPVAVAHAPDPPWNPLAALVIGGVKTTFDCAGQGTGFYSSEMTGLIDEVQFFNRPLTASEIEAAAGRCGFLACGDGTAFGTEECDDGSLTSNDGCSAACENEICISPDFASPTILTSWWDAEASEGGLVIDLAGQSEAFLVNGVTLVGGKVGLAFNLDGVDDYISIPRETNFDFHRTDPFTIDAWVKTGSQATGTILSKLEPNTLTGYELRMLADGSFNFFMGAGPVSVTTVETGFNDDEWHHVAVTYGGGLQIICQAWSQVKIYVDGVERPVLGSGFLCGGMTNNVPLQIGRRSDVNSDLFNGAIDEVEVFTGELFQGTGTLTPSQVQALYQAGSAGKCKPPGPVGVLPAGVLGVFSSDQLAAVFGTAPYTWDLVSGLIPDGMALSPDGVLSGTPTQAGVFTFTVDVTDSNNLIIQKSYSKKVSVTVAPPQIRLKKVGTTPVAGRVIDYFILVENLCDVLATDVGIIETLNTDDHEFLSAKPVAAVTQEPGTTILRWTIAAIPPHGWIVLHYQTRLSVSLSVGDMVLGNACEDSLTKDNLQMFAESAAIASISSDPPCPACTAVALTAIGVCSFIPSFLENCHAAARQIALCYCKKCPEQMFALGATAGQAGLNCSFSCREALAGKDPNEKSVVAGTFIRSDQVLLYPVHFENVGNAEALDVFVTDTLEDDLDLSTLEIMAPDGSFLPLADGQVITLFEQDKVKIIVIDPENNITEEIIIHEKHTVTLEGRMVRWSLEGIELEPAATGEVFLSIRPMPSLPSGTEITNEATIQFENLEPLTTAATLNIIDDVAPEGVVDTLPPTSPPWFPLSWSGADEVGEIASYTLFVSENGGPYTPFLTTADTSTVYVGEPNRTYAFICIAADTAGNLEVQDPVAEATTNTNDAVDTTPPFLAVDPVTSPTDVPGQVITGTVADLAGQGEVASGVAGVTINGAPAGIDGDTYTGFVVLVEGANVIEVIATDRAGNQTVENVEIVLLTDADGDGVADDVDNCPAVANADQLDSDGDGAGNACDPDDDNDTVADGEDAAPLNKFACRDVDADGCNDCTSGLDDPAADGPDADGDGICNAGDADDDNDGVADEGDLDPLNPSVCGDVDGDDCDDCNSGSFDPFNDGLDFDGDGSCDFGDSDDDSDGVPDDVDANPVNRFVCRDADGDACDDCASGVDDPAADGPDHEPDGLCDDGDPDDDNDGLDDADEVTAGTNLLIPDTDGDGLLDGTEVHTAVNGCPNPLNPDSDGDTITDGDEVAGGTNPCSADTDGDGVADNVDPQPTQPGVTTGFLEDEARDLAEDILALDLNLNLFSGPNSNANKGLRNSLANRAVEAANKIAAAAEAAAVPNDALHDQLIQEAIDELSSLLDKIDGQSPPPDWMNPSTEKSDLADRVSLLISLLQFEL